MHPASVVRLGAHIDRLAAFHFLAKRLAEALHRQDGLTSGGRAVLREVYGDPNATIAGMAGWRGVSHQAIQRTVAELCTRGLLTKTVEEGDRRGRRLGVTPAGRELLARIEAREARELSALLPGIDSSDLAAAERSLERLWELMAMRLAEMEGGRDP